MSYVDELNRIEQESKKRRANEKSQIELYTEGIIEHVKTETARIASQGGAGSHHAEGFAGGDTSEGLGGLYKNSEYPSLNFAWSLNQGILSVEDLDVICRKVQDELTRMKFKRVSVEIVKEDLSDIESHPANIEMYGYSEVKGVLFKRKGRPKKYLIYVSVDW